MQTVSEPGDFSASKAEWWINLVLRRASELRTLGVTELSAEGYAVKLSPFDPTPPKLDDVKNDEPLPDGIDALNDPRSYPGGIVPGYSIERISHDEE